MSGATDIRYGRRGGRWVSHRPGQLLAELRLIRNRLKAEGRWATPTDRSRLFHPETIAATRAHHRDCPGPHTSKGEDCPARPDPDDLAAVWAGRARMAAARQAAGLPLDALDGEALTRAQPADTTTSNLPGGQP